MLKPRKARPFYGRHPWVLDSAIDDVEGTPADGDVVDLLSDKGKFIARGIFNSRSRIRVRLYTWNASEQLDDAFWRRRLESAMRFRSELGLGDPQGAARLVFSEGDGLSGLIVDRYADYLAVQVTALAMAVRLPQIVPMLVELTQPRGVCPATERGISKAEGLELRDGLYWGETPAGPLVIVENGLRYELDLAEGQKTGFYLDQRENRAAAARYFRGRRVLDMFCYSGGFSLARGCRRRPRGAGRRYQPEGRGPGPGQRRAERPGKRAVPCRRRLQDAGIAGRRRRAVRRRGARSAQVRPQPQRRRRSPAGLPLAQPPGRRPARAGRNPGHVQLLGPRQPRGFLLHARGRRPADRPRNPGARTARRVARPSGGRDVPGEGVFEVFYLPGWMKGERKIEERREKEAGRSQELRGGDARRKAGDGREE